MPVMYGANPLQRGGHGLANARRGPEQQCVGRRRREAEARHRRPVVARVEHGVRRLQRFPQIALLGVHEPEITSLELRHAVDGDQLIQRAGC